MLRVSGFPPRTLKPEGGFFNAFADEVEVLTESATSDAQHISGRIDCMLARFVLIPSDGFDPDCAPAETD